MTRIDRWIGSGAALVAAKAVLAVVLGAASSLALGDEPFAFGCGSLENAYGPYDYRNATHRREKLPIVESAHFTIDVFELRRGVTATFPLVDIDYTLRAFPNHHLALDAMARLHRREGVERFPQGRYSLACWFERARQWQPDDGMVYLIYGTHLFYTDRLKEAEPVLLKATELLPRSAEAHYNLGLLYVRLGNHEEAARWADKAYELGAQLPGLREQLAKAASKAR
ncbi:MAG: tetratricopeptide repeat protein [Gammaproteobacteria bacterium]